MNFASSALIGFFFGFALGVGCALAVMYSIYSGGYRRAVEDSLCKDHPVRYRKGLARAVLLSSRREEKPEAQNLAK